MANFISPVEFYDTVVAPDIFQRLDQVFPEFDWRRRGPRWDAGPAGEDACRLTLNSKYQRVTCKDGRGPFAGNGEWCSWTAYVCGGIQPKGDEYRSAVIKICELAGIDHSPISVTGGVSEKQAEKWKKEHGKRAAKAAEQTKIAQIERRREDERQIKLAQKLYENAVEDHPAIEAYARDRLGLDEFTVPGGLRYGHAGLPGDIKAILAPILRDDELVAVQRIFVDVQGKPEPQEIYDGGGLVRKATKGRPSGGAVLVGDIGGTAGLLVLCEGVETGWAIHHATGCAVWACISTSGLVNIEIPVEDLAQVSRIVIAADRDRINKSTKMRPGHDYAQRAADRIAKMHPTASVCAVAPGYEEFPDLVEINGDPANGAKSVDWLDVYTLHGSGPIKTAIRGAEVIAGRDENLEDPQRPKPRSFSHIMPAEELARAERAIIDLFAPDEPGRPNAAIRLMMLDGAFVLHDGERYKHLDKDGRAVRQLVRRWARPFDSSKRRNTKDREPYYTPANLSLNSLNSIVTAIGDELLVLRDDEYQQRFWLRPMFDEHGVLLRLESHERIVLNHEAEKLPDPDLLIPLPSGLFDVQSWLDDMTPRIIPHSERFFCENLVGVDLRSEDFEAIDGGVEDLKAAAEEMCPLWIQLLVDVFGAGDRSKAQADIHELHKYIGYCLVPDISKSQGNMAFFHGPPGAGKSTVMTMIRELLGPVNCVSSRMDQLTDGPHMSAWIGKLLAVFPDADPGNRSDKRLNSEIIKLITGGDSISLRKMYKDPIPGLVLFARLLFAVNQLPNMPDPTGAFSRRSIFFGFKHPAKNPNTDLTKGKRLLLQPESMRGVLMLAICGLNDLHHEGFGEPPSGGSLAEEFRSQSTAFYEFVDSCLEVIDPEELESEAIPMMPMHEMVELFELFYKHALGREDSKYAPDTITNTVGPLLQARGWKGGRVHDPKRERGPYFFTQLKTTGYAEGLQAAIDPPIGHRQDDLPIAPTS